MPISLNKKVIQKIKVATADSGKRLDIILSEKLDISRSKAQTLVKGALVLVNDKLASSKYLIEPKDIITVLEKNKGAVPDIKIIFEDKDILVIDKPAGITSHPAPGESDTTISEIFADKYTGKQDTEREMVVHRLDKGTSGIMVMAKNDAARASLVAQFAARKVNKTYVALVFGKVSPKEGVIDMPLARDLISKNRIAPADEGKDAKTLYSVTKYYTGYTLVKANPKTGRTHQIRVHFSAIGHPLYGDVRYGAKDTGAKRIFLHAAELSFLHPRTGGRVKFASPLPVELASILSKLSFE